MSLSSKVVFNASVLAAGRFLIIGSGIVTVGLSTRYLGPAAYGAFSVALAFVGILASVNDLGLTTIGAREIAKRPEETQRIIASVLTVSLIIGAIGAGIGFVATNLVYSGDENRLVRQGIDILLLTLIVAAPISAGGAYFVAVQKAYTTMVASVAGTATSLLLLVLTTTLDWGFLGVVSAYAAMLVVNAFVIVILLLKRKVRLSLSFDVSLWKQLLAWSLPLAGLALLSTLYARLDIVLLAALQSDSAAGVYSVAYKVLDALVILPPYIMITLLPAVSRLEPHSARLAELTQKSFSALLVGAVAVFVLFVGFADEVIEIVAGPEFQRAAPVLQILMVGVSLGFAAAVFGNSLIALNQQGRMLKLMPLVLAVNLVLNLALIPLWGLHGAAVALSATEVFGLLGIMYLYTRVGSLPTIQRGPQVLLAGGAMAAVVLAKLLPFASAAPPALVIAVLGSASVVVYTLCLYALGAMPAEVHRGLIVPVWNRVASLAQRWLPPYDLGRQRVSAAEGERNTRAAQTDEREPHRRLRRRLSDCLTAASGLRAGLFRGDLPLDAAQQVVIDWRNTVCRVLYEEDANHLTEHFIDESDWRQLAYRGTPGGDSDRFTNVVNALDKQIQRLQEIIAMVPETESK